MSFKATFEVAAFKDSGNVRYDIGINEDGLANNSFRVLCYIHMFF